MRRPARRSAHVPLILLYVALTILRPQDYLPGMENVPVLPAVLALAFVAWLISNAKNFEAPQFVILPAFLLVLMASQVVNGWTGGAMDELARFGPVVAAFFVLASACHTQRRVTVAMGVFVACAAILALHGVEQARTGTGWTGIPLSEGGRIQYVGIFNDPNDLGLLFAATLPMAVFLGRRGAGPCARYGWAPHCCFSMAPISPTRAVHCSPCCWWQVAISGIARASRSPAFLAWRGWPR